jgi:hypothetical protein
MNKAIEMEAELNEDEPNEDFREDLDDFDDN